MWLGLQPIALAEINIESTTTYSTVISEDKFKNLGDYQAENEERFAVLYDVLRNYANGRYSASDVNRNLSQQDVMQTGDKLSIYKTKGSVVGSDIEAEPIVRIGAGSNIVNDKSNYVDVENTPSAQFAGKQYTFAGGETFGVVSIGNVRRAKGRKLLGVSAGMVNSKSMEAVNGSQLYAAQQAINDLSKQVEELKKTVNSLKGR